MARGTVARRHGGRTTGALGMLLGLAAASGAVAQAPTSLTLYNDGRVLVRRTLPLELPRGESEQRFSLGVLDPGSVFPLDDGVSFTGTGYDAAVDEQSVLRRAIGKRIRFRSGNDTTSAELVGVDPERYRMKDGSISFLRPGLPMYPAELVALEPTLRANVTSNAARKGLRIGYFTQGGGWSASYEVVLGGREAPARVTGRAVVNGGPLNIEDTELQLLAGQVSTAATSADYAPRAQALALERKAMAAAPAEQKVGEFHLYTLPGRVSLKPGQVSTIALFEPATAKVTRTFQVTGQLPYWGGLGQYGEEEEVPVTVTYTVLRPRKTDLGDRPLPGGTVRLYEPDSAGRVQLIGESSIDHSPAGEDLRLNAGNAFDLTAKRVQTNYATRRDSIPGGGGWRTIATADYRVTITNAADQAATVEVIETRGGEWSVVSSSVKPEKLSSTRTAFRVPVPAKGKATLTYRVRVVW